MASYEQEVLADAPAAYWPLDDWQREGGVWRNLGSAAAPLRTVLSSGSDFAEEEFFTADTDPYNWASGAIFTGNNNTFKVASKNIYGKIDASANGASGYTGPSYTGDMEIAARIGSSTGGSFAMFMCLTPGGTPTGYALWCDTSGPNVQIRRIEGGGNGALLAQFAVSWVESDVLALRRVGNVLIAFKNGAVIGYAQDSTYAASGRCGLWFNGPASSNSYHSLGGFWFDQHFDGNRPQRATVRPDGGKGVAFDSTAPNNYALTTPIDDHNGNVWSALRLNAPATVEFWFRHIGWREASGTVFPTPIAILGGGDTDYELYYSSVDAPPDNWRFYRAGTYRQIGPATPLLDGSPHHIALTIDNAAEASKSFRGYIDGVLRNTVASVTWGTLTSTQHFGVNINTPARFAMSDLAIYTTELPASAIRRHYLAGLS